MITPRIPQHTGACVCRDCGERFARLSVFDAHRIGKDADRRCRTIAEMHERGWTRDARSCWHLSTRGARPPQWDR